MAFKKGQHQGSPNDDIFSEEIVEAGEIATESRITIGVAGITSHIGVTTQAIQMTEYLFYNDKPVAYVEMNNTGFIDAVLQSYEDTKEDEDGNVIYERITLIRKENLRKVSAKKFKYLVFDYGSIRAKTFDPVSFCERNVQVLVCGSSPQEYVMTTAALMKPEFKKARLLFNFVPKDDRKAIEDMMTDRINDTFFTAYAPDMFISCEKMDNVYRQILPE